MDTVGELPYAAIDAVHMDPTEPMPMWDRGTALDELSADTVETLLVHAGAESGTPLAMVELRLLGGAIARRPEVPNAVSGRDAAYSVFTVGVPVGPEPHLVPAASAALVEALRPWACAGGLVNLLGQASPRRVGALWSAADRARLVDTARRYDPEGTFATNVVIG
jgi:hypothetical protein